MAEYALILGGIAIVVILAIVFLGGEDRATSSGRPAAPSRTRSRSTRPSTPAGRDHRLRPAGVLAVRSSAVAVARATSSCLSTVRAGSNPRSSED